MTHSASPVAAVASLARHRGLLAQFVRRQVASRYRGSMLGIVWSLMTPLLMLAVYSFVFVIVFKARWGADTGPRGEFAVMLFSGLVLHGFLAECISRAPGVILENRNLVKKVVFPLELLPVAAVCSALFQLLVSFVVLLLGVLLVYHRLPLTLVYLPAVVLPLVLFALGLVTVATRRNAVAILMGVELILNAAGLNFVAFSHYGNGAITGQVFTVFIIVLAATEAAIALAIVLAVFGSFRSIDAADAATLKE